MPTARGLSLDRSKSLARERALDQELLPLVGPEEGVEVDAATPDEELAAGMQGRFGNDLVQQSLYGGGFDGGLGSLVLADFAMASVGVAGSSLLGASNSAMLAVMRDARGPDGATQGARVNSALQRGGRALPADLQARLEAAFGISLRGVEIHDDAAAHGASDAVNAHAFTVGTDIFFGRGEYAPGTHDGEELIAHEVTHVVQHLENRSGRPTSVEGDVPVTRPTDAVEREAYAFGAAFADGQVAAMSESPVEVATPTGGGETAFRDARNQSGGDQEEETNECREPTPEELAAMDQATTGTQQGQQQADQAGDTPAVQDIPTDQTQSGGSIGGGSMQEQEQNACVIGDDVSAQTPGSPLAFDPTNASPVVQYMIAMGPKPEENPTVDAAQQLVESNWGTSFLDSIGPLIGYQSDRGGFEFDNIWGVGKAVDDVFAVAGKDRGEGPLATAIEVMDTLRSVAEGVGTIAGAIGTTCLVLSLIGLIPPLAPVGAALFSVSQICTLIGTWAAIIAAALSLVVSVLSAIQLVEAVRDGSPRVAELYANYQSDVAGLLANGINLGLVLLQNKLGKNDKSQAQLFKAVSATDGRVARGAAYQGLKAWYVPKTLLSMKNTTRTVLTSALFVKVMTNPIKTYRWGRTVDGWMRGMKQDATNSAKQRFSASSTAALSVPTAPSFGSGIAGRLKATIPPASTESTAPQVPIPDHSPMELNDIAAQRAQIAAALERARQRRSEGQGAIDGGQTLGDTASEHEANACLLDEQVSSHADGLQTHADQARDGEQQARDGQVQTSQMGDQTTSLQGSAQTKQSQAQSVQMPAKPKSEGFWGRIKAWFQEQVFDRVKAALNAVRQFMADMIMKIVAFCMGVDDIEGQLADAQSAMQASGQQTAQSQQQNEVVSQNAQGLHQQASQATADANQSISLGEQEVATADAQEGELLAMDAQLQAEAEEVQAYTAQFEADWGPAFEQDECSADAVDASVIDGFRGEANAVRDYTTTEEDAISGIVAQARDAISADATAAGLDVQTVMTDGYLPLEEGMVAFNGRQAERRQRLDAVDGVLGQAAEAPATEGTQLLDRMADAIESIAVDASRDSDSFRAAVTDWMAQLAQSMEGTANVSSGEEISRKASAPLDRDTATPVAPKDAGAPLPAAMAARLGPDAAGVRVHTGPAAAEFAEGLSAKAATVGSDIYFAGGEYDPQSRAGQELLAHEVHHAVEGGAGAGISQPGDAHEVAADAFAASFVNGGAPTLEAGTGGMGISLKEEKTETGGEEEKKEPPPGTDVDALLTEGTEVADAGRSDKPKQEGKPVIDAKEKVEKPKEEKGKKDLGLDAKGPGKSDKKGDKDVKPAQKEGQPKPQLKEPEKAPVNQPPNLTPKGQASPEVLVAAERVKGAADKEKQGITTEGEAQKAQIRAAGDAQKGAVLGASATLMANISASFAQLTQDIQTRGEGAKATLAQQRDQQKSLITSQAAAEIARMAQAVTDRRNQLQALGTQLAADAKLHGQNEATRAINGAAAKAEQAQAIGETKAGQYANYDEAKEIAATARKMGRETAKEIVKQGAEVAKQCIQDGVALAAKIDEDTQALLKNFGEGTEPATKAINEARDKALASCDQSYNDAVVQVDKAVADSLVGVRSGEKAALASAAEVALAMLPAIENAVKQACASVDQGVAAANAQIDTAVAQVVAAAGNVHPKKSKEALEILATVEGSIMETGAGARAGLAAMAGEAVESVNLAGGEAATMVLASGETIVEQNAAVKTQFESSMAQIETSTAGGFAQAGTDSNAKMKEAADAFIGKLDESFTEGKDKLTKTSTDGKAEITKKVNEIVAKWEKSVGELGAAIDKKAKEIENASWWDKLCSAVGGFFKGFFSQLWNWVKDLLLVLAIVLLVLVILVVLVVVLVAIFPALLGPLLAGLIFLAVWGPLILTIVGYIGLAIGVIMAAVSIYQSWKAWNNPNLTWEEKWEQTGRTTFDIVDAIGPEKFLKPIAGVFKGAKGVEALSDVAAVGKAGDLAGDVSKLTHVDDAAKLSHVDDVAKLGHVDDAAKLTNAQDVSKVTHVDDVAKADDAAKLGGKAADLKKTEDAATKVDDAKKLTHADDTKKIEEAKKLGGADDSKRVTKGKEVEEAAKVDDAKKVDDVKKADDAATKADDGKKVADVEDAAKKGADMKGGASGKKWDDPTLTKDEFIADYRKKYPKSDLTDAQLGDRFADGKRLNPETGRMATPEWKKQTPAAGKGKMTNEEIRGWYNKEVGRIDELDDAWKAQGLNAEERARRAHALRHEARIKAREMMGNADDVEKLRARDMETYGNPDGPTFDQLVAKGKKKGLTGDAVYEDMVGSSKRTSAEYNAKNGVTGKNESTTNNSGPKDTTAKDTQVKPGQTEATAKAKSPDPVGPSGKKWNDPKLTEAEFIADYRARHPNTNLTDAQLAERFKSGQRLNPETGRLKKPDVAETKDVTKTVAPEASDPTKGAPKRVDVPKSANNADDILKKSAADLKGDAEAQKRLFEAVQESNAKMQKAAEDIAKELGVDVPQTGIKGNKPGGKLEQQKFIDGVLEKNARNNYDQVGQMKDMTRGRFEVDSAQEVEAAAHKLVEKFSKEFGTDYVSWKKPKGDYPRHHVVVTDPATGIAHEWQIGSKATTKFIEGMDVPLPPGVKLHAKPDFHTVKYDVLDKLNDPAVRAKHGLPDDIVKKTGLDKLEDDYNKLFRETGTTTKDMPMPKDFDVRQKALADEMARIMKELEAQHPGIVQKLDTKLQGPGHAADVAKGGDVAKVATTDVPKVPKSVNNAEDILGKGAQDLKNSDAAQQKLFDAVQETNAKMQKAADDIADELGVDRITTGIKGNKPGTAPDRQKFIAGVLEKNARNDYKQVGQMKDMTRARFDLDGAEQVESAAQKLVDKFTKEFGADAVNWKKPKGDYPRHHILVTDPATGIAHEWQIGSKATTKFIEGMDVPLPPGVKLHAKPDFHTVKYDVLDKLHDPAVRAKHGLPDDIVKKSGLDKLEEDYNALFRETGKTSKDAPMPKDFEARQKALADEMARIMNELESQHPGIVQKLDTKLQAPGHGPDVAKAADVTKVAPTDVPKVPKSANNAEDVLGKGAGDLKNSEAAQQKLFDAVQETNAKMQKAADDIADELGVDRITTGIKGNKPGTAPDRKKFIDGVLEKNARNDYKQVGQMKDMTRARFDLDGAEQVESAAQKLADRFTKEFGAGAVNWKKPKGDYPRHHILVTDPATGIAHEWQIGSKATTKFIEGMEVPLPSGVHLHARADFHVVKYDVLDKLHNPDLLKKHGLPSDIASRVGLDKLEADYNQLFRETGKTTKGQPLPKDFEARQKALADQMGEILAKLEKEKPGIVSKLDTKGKPPAAAADPKKAAGVKKEKSAGEQLYDLADAGVDIKGGAEKVQDPNKGTVLEGRDELAN